MKPFLLSLVIILSATAGRSQAATPKEAGGNNDSVVEAKPVIKWSFNDSKEPGPRSPSYPIFDRKNTAARADGKSAVLRVSGKEGKLAGDLQFGLKDEITLEAWVKPTGIKDGSFVYVLGKGRTQSSFKNQNYSLRVAGAKDQAKINFLFASAALPGAPAGWHRWTSSQSFSQDSWHHIAISYTFGDPKSLRGYIDGKLVEGTWDMDGATDRAPARDDDDLLIGTGNGDGSSARRGNAFTGLIDEVAIWKTTLEPEVIASRYQHIPPAPVVARKDVPAGQVLMHICEDGIPETGRAWPAEAPKPVKIYTERAFGFFEQPLRYVSSGVRGEWASPHLMRAAAVVSLPPGKHRLLLRGRGGSRLYIDNQAVLTTPFNTQSSSGHGRVSIQNQYLNLGPDFRFAPPGNRESTCEFETKGGEHFIIMETLVGAVMGKSFRRPELGETVLAWSPEGSESWQLLSPAGEHLPYTDSGWAAYQEERRAHYAQVNAAERARLRDSQESYWSTRRAAAQKWLSTTPEPAVPDLAPGLPAHNTIDHFLAAKIAKIRTELVATAEGSVDYHKQVQPILEAKCYDCHQGGKAKGGLRLDDAMAAREGGDSDGAAIKPGDPKHSALIARVTTRDEDDFMPPKGTPLTPEEIEILTTWIKEGAHWPEMKVAHTDLTPLTDDLAFLRRVYLDTVGVPPTLDEIAAFRAKPDRDAVIDALLQDPRWADHWTGYWQDVLAENPNLINPTLNNSGPFRWWIHESLLDNKPMDLFVTELLRMEGSERYGGPQGFAIANQNDVPMAEKGIIVSSAFLGVEMKCARCHDSPAHRSTQEELFQIAAMLQTEPLTVPKTSSVPMDRFHETGRTPLIQVTLQPGTTVEPGWPFQDFCDEKTARKLAADPANSRDVLAALISAPQNERFPQVLVNRLWARLMGRGIVQNVADWERSKPTHPDLLTWLGRELVRGGYDLKHIASLILKSHAYQRATDPSMRESSPLFIAPAPRRLDAEQIVDSLFAAAGKPFKTEEASLDIDGARDVKNSISLGNPTRSWMLTTTANERDRPSLALPRVQAIADVLSAFGWRGTRQDPVSKRDTDPNTLQPAIISNGTVGTWLTVLSDDHGVTDLSLQAESPEQLVDTLFLKLLTRQPTAAERKQYVEHLRPGFDQRIVDSASLPPPQPGTRIRPKYVSWSNHLDPEATLVRQEQEADSRRGDPPTERLTAAWRTRAEDVLWSILNAPEWVFAP